MTNLATRLLPLEDLISDCHRSIPITLMAFVIDFSMAWQIWEAEDSFLGVSSKSGEEDKVTSSLPAHDSFTEISVLNWGNCNLVQQLSLFPKNTDLMDRSRMSNEGSQSMRAVGKVGWNIDNEKIRLVDWPR